MAEKTVYILKKGADRNGMNWTLVDCADALMVVREQMRDRDVYDIGFDRRLNAGRICKTDVRAMTRKFDSQQQ